MSLSTRAPAPAPAVAERKPSSAAHRGLLQRKCACGGSAGAGEMCEECAKKRLQRRPAADGHGRAALPFVQTRLVVGPAGDRWEQEADRIAEAVVRVPDAALGRPAEGAHGATPTPGAAQVRRKPREVTPVAEDEGVLRRRPVSGVPADRVQRQAEGPDEDDELLRRKPAVSAAAADRVQRHGEEEETLQPSRSGRGGGEGGRAAAGFGARLDAQRAAGRPLPREVRGYMEARFGVDFGRVRVHTGRASAELAADIHAQAFTLGHDIYFGAGYYDPTSTAGRQLLAHELVHTLQQNPGQTRRPRTADGGAASPSAPWAATTTDHPSPTPAGAEAGPVAAAPAAPSAAPRLQRKTVALLGPKPKERLKGTKVHSRVLPAFGKANPGLYTEVAIPGANKMDVDKEKRGAVDFYLGSTTVAIRTQQGQPAYLDSDRDLLKGGKKFKHKELGAPLGPEVPGGACALPKPPGKGKKAGGKKTPAATATPATAPSTTPAATAPAGPSICRADQAPKNIWLGDLKPGGGGLAEAYLGIGQLQNYDDGLTNTAKDLNGIVQKDATRSDPPGTQWQLKVDRIRQLRIPSEYAWGTASSEPRQLVLFHENGGYSPPLAGMTGYLTVYKGDQPGIWVYEWIPKKVPDSVRKDPTKSAEYTGVIQRLDALTATLAATPKKLVKKAAAGAPPRRLARSARRPAPRRVVRRKAKPFDPATWQGDYKAWKGDAKKFMGGPVAENLRVAGALADLQDRAKVPLGISSAVQKGARGLERVEHWERWGGVYGRLRKTLGGLYVKVAGLYDRAATRLKELREKTSPTGGGGGGDKLVAAIFRVAWKTASTFFRVVTDQVVKRLRSALEKGVETLVKEFFGEKNIEKVAEAKADLEAMATRWEAAELLDVKARLDALVKPYEEDLKFISNLGKWLGDISKIVSAVRWAARVVQCLTPPGVGCLKLLLQAVAEKALEMVVETCWFQKYIVAPLFKGVDFIKKLPDRLADAVIEQVKALLPFDQALKDKLLPVGPMGAVELTSADLGCDDKHLTREHIAMGRLLDKHGPAKVKQLIALMEKAGVGEKQELTLGMIDQMDKALSSLTKDQLQTAVATYSGGGGTGPLDALVQSIKAGPAPAGGGGGEPAKEGAKTIKVVSASKAKFEGKGAGKSERGGVYVDSFTFEGTSRDRARLTLVGLVDGQAVIQVSDVPATAGKAEDVTREGEPHRSIPFTLEQGVRFEHGVKGVSTFVLEKGTVVKGLEPATK